MEVDEDLDQGDSRVGRNLASNRWNKGSKGQDKGGNCSHSVTEAAVLEEDTEVKYVQEKEGHENGDDGRERKFVKGNVEVSIVEGFNFGLFLIAVDWKNEWILIIVACIAYIAYIGFIKHRTLIAFVENYLFDFIDNFFAVFLHLGCKMFIILEFLPFHSGLSEHDLLADSVVSVDGANSFFGEIVVAESAPVGKADFFFNVGIVLQVKLNLEFGIIGFSVFLI